MRAVVQRVSACAVTVRAEVVAHIDEGVLAYVSVEPADDEQDADYLADKIVNLRIFPDAQGKMNLSALSARKELLVVSQFTLHADARKGRRPSYDGAASPAEAEPLYQRFLELVAAKGITPQAGVFGAFMEVTYTNRGPVTILLDSKRLF